MTTRAKRTVSVALPPLDLLAVAAAADRVVSVLLAAAFLAFFFLAASSRHALASMPLEASYNITKNCRKSEIRPDNQYS